MRASGSRHATDDSGLDDRAAGDPPHQARVGQLRRRVDAQQTRRHLARLEDRGEIRIADKRPPVDDRPAGRRAARSAAAPPPARRASGGMTTRSAGAADDEPPGARLTQQRSRARSSPCRSSSAARQRRARRAPRAARRAGRATPVTRESVPSATVTRAVLAARRRSRAATSAVAAPKRNAFEAGHHTRPAPARATRRQPSLVDRHAVDDDGVRLQAAERLERAAVRRAPSSSTPSARCTKNGASAGVARQRRGHVAAWLAARAGRTRLEEERMRPAVAPHDANRHGAPHLRIERVVMRDRRHAGEQVLEARR